ncbi:PREDICTED: leptin receptor gene-related protein [Dufourea novaeangliae]|uniref:leptin receptor gene-related protein n=1 Tax=Dufourea novaeangliae TaxID=178035 RepID=UPI000767648F|nr:PREDICTED: leptin receptor gene-related protein [Dufourea novaeangliae]
MVLGLTVYKALGGLRHKQSKSQTFVYRLVFSAFAGSIGITCVLLGCTIPANKVWWPFFVVLFYALSPIPTGLAVWYTNDYGSNRNPCLELAVFITMGFIVSSFGLPIVLARSPASDPVIEWVACYLTLTGNVIVYLTLLYFMTSDQEEHADSVW